MPRLWYWTLPSPPDIMLALLDDRMMNLLMNTQEQRSHMIQNKTMLRTSNGLMLPKNNLFDAGITELDENGRNRRTTTTKKTATDPLKIVNE